ncbi:aberrant root formation protein 4 [Pyrus ussuriensis x Pyrus communis]|uniref:Aberrant root formation protein 4 n=1 Tax=Pyrus ussuriensis x Pyrus communis TaxID=2448454 RepID=A0A5N5I0R1_9ROSA|nr:aberrant root formation protein 4 [Pyrus ussuriensis x Pyrus communis]
MGSERRRHFEQVKVAVPIIVKVLKAQSLELEDEDPEFKDLFDRALAIAHSIRSVCVKLEGVANEKLRALLGLYVLQIMAIVSMNHNVTSSQLFVLQLSSFFPFCGLSYLGVITGSDVDKRTRAVVGGKSFQSLMKMIYMSCLSDVKCGAPLLVIWGHASDDVVRAAEGDLTSVKHEPKNNQTERWQAVGMLKHILAPASLPWELKRYTINFLILLSEYYYSFMFTNHNQILADIPASQRFDMLEYYRMWIVKGELHKESCQKVGNDEHCNVLELVELILKPPEGGPPSFPEDTDKVFLQLALFEKHNLLYALNLYRFRQFFLLKIGTGKTNHTGVLSRSNLQKPYRTRNDYELPLELVEDQLKQ